MLTELKCKEERGMKRWLCGGLISQRMGSGPRPVPHSSGIITFEPSTTYESVTQAATRKM